MQFLLHLLVFGFQLLDHLAGGIRTDVAEDIRPDLAEARVGARGGGPKAGGNARGRPATVSHLCTLVGDLRSEAWIRCGGQPKLK